MPSGLFWTIPIPASSVQWNYDAGTASMKLSSVPLNDYIKIPNALMRGRNTPATASLELTWSGVINRKFLRDDANAWGGTFAETAAKVTFTAQTGGFTFTSTETNNQEFSVIGRERNGSYYRDALRLGDG